MRKHPLSKKLSFLFLEILGIAVFFFAFFIFSSIILVPKIALLLESVFHTRPVLCNCIKFLAFHKNPTFFLLYFGLGIALFAVLIFSMHSVWKIYKKTKKFTRKIFQNKITPSVKIQNAALALELKNKIIEVNSKKPLVFCFGFYNPKICISNTLVKKLTQDELLAVLLHEREHMRLYEPLKLFVIGAITSLLKFFPGIEKLGNTYKMYSELSADFIASDKFQKKSPLARALVKVMEIGNMEERENTSGISYFSIITDQRIRALETGEKPKIKIYSKNFSHALVSIALFVFLFYKILLSSPAADAEGSSSGHNCLAAQTYQALECSMGEETVCEIPFRIESPLCQ